MVLCFRVIVVDLCVCVCLLTNTLFYFIDARSPTALVPLLEPFWVVRLEPSFTSDTPFTNEWVLAQATQS